MSLFQSVLRLVCPTAMDCESYPTVKRKPKTLATDDKTKELKCTCGQKNQLPDRRQHEEPQYAVPEQQPDQDRLSTQSDAETSPTGGFRRGTRLRTSLPLIRSPNRSMERPMGQVFLTFRNETKRALLPNELTSVDTIRALFVRSFPDALSMQLFESHAKRIYLLDPATSVFYELDNLRDVRDKSVLKVVERNGALPPAPPSPLRSPALRRTEALGSSGGFPGYDSDSSSRSAPVSSPRSPAHGRPPASPRLFHYEVPSKTGTLPVQPNYVSIDQIKRQAATCRGNPPWSPTRGRHQCPNGPSRSNQSSPQRTPVYPPAMTLNPQRHSVAYLPDQGVYGQIGVPMQQSRSYHDYPDGDCGSSSHSGSITPTHDTKETKHRMEKMEVQLANLQAWVEQAARLKPPSQQQGSVRSVISAVSDGSVKSKSSSGTPTLESPASVGQPGMSDISSATPQPFISVDLQKSICSLQKKAFDLRSELSRLKQTQLCNQENMRQMMQETFNKIKESMAHLNVEGSVQVHQVQVQSERQKINSEISEYKSEASKVNKDLSDLVTSVEELRTDVLNKKCRVNLSEVESLALALSQISKSLADLKNKFPTLSERMKIVMANEIEEVVSEEKFIKEEPDSIDNSLKRCKKLTGTLFTLKRLAAVQEQRPPQIPQIKTNGGAADRNDLLDNIVAMVPDHDARLQSLQATEESRERKMKIIAGTEALKFSKSIEIAQKQLRETHNMTANEQRQEKRLSEIYAAEKHYDDPNDLKKEIPKKPPRTMEYGENDVMSDESVNVSAISSVQAVDSTSQNSSSNSVSSAGSAPVTSTPKNHVTFSGTVVEISENKDMKTKKIPPPPPPRKSSSKTLASPVSKIQQMPLPPTPESPPTYENLDSLRQKQKRPKSAEVVRDKGPAPAAVRPHSEGADGPTIQDLYAKVNQKDDTEDSSGSSTSIDSQKDGKRPATVTSSVTVTMSNHTNGGKRAGPPPPLRLMSAPAGDGTHYSTAKECKANGQSVAMLQKTLFNGQKTIARQPQKKTVVAKQQVKSSTASSKQSHEETEIY